MARRIIFTFPAADAAAICALQTTAAAGAFIINGTNLVAADFAVGVRKARFTNHQRVVTLTSTGNISAVNFTIVGFDTQGVAVTETRAGPNNNTVSTTAEYACVTSVTVSAAVGTNTSVGSGSTGTTAWAKLDRYQDPISVAIEAAITATLSFTVQYTYADVETVASPVTYNHPILAAITATADQTLGVAAVALRGIVNSSSGSGAVTMTASQAYGSVA